jgi:hypothetical protein
MDAVAKWDEARTVHRPSRNHNANNFGIIPRWIVHFGEVLCYIRKLTLGRRRFIVSNQTGATRIVNRRSNFGRRSPRWQLAPFVPSLLRPRRTP